MYQPAPAVPYIELTVRLGGDKLVVTNKFTYLASTSSRTVTINEEVNYRSACAITAFGILQANVWGKERY